MRFFIPSANDPHQGEELYRKIREQVAAAAGWISDRRVYRLKFNDAGHRQIAVVGSDRHCFGNGPVLAIFEGPNGVHYVCTKKNGNFEAEPHPIPSATIIESEDFSALG